MKRITKTMKMVAAMLSLCLVCVLGITAEAAKYQPGITYVNPDTSYYKNESEYYSVKKIRMSTYSDRDIKIIYPKDATLEVKSPKKAMQVMITEQDNADTYDNDWNYTTSEKIYVTATVTEYKYYYKNYATGETELLTLDPATGQYYYTEYVESVRVYDAELGYWVWKAQEPKKVYVAPNYTVPMKATYTDAATNTVYTYERYDEDNSDLYYDEDKELFYYSKSLDKVYKYKSNQTIYYDDATPDYDYAVAWVKLTSTKAGTYKVNVFVNGQKTTMTVYVSAYTSPYKKATLAGKTVYSDKVKKTANNDSYTTVYNHNVKKNLKSAKFKVSANKGFKVTGIVSTYLNSKGKAIYKKGKNGSKITLSQVYDYDSNSSNGSYSRSSTKNTYVYVSWKDTKLKTSCTYSVVKKNGVKMIKRVEKKTDGKKYTSYLEYGESDWNDYMFDLWSY